MRLSLSVNGSNPVVASLQSRGYLSAHLNLSTADSEYAETNCVQLVGIDTSDALATTHLRWPCLPVMEGDRVEIEVLADGEGDLASEVSNTADSPTNLLTQTAVARQVLSLADAINTKLMGMLRVAEEVEPAEELQKLRLAVASIVVELDRQIQSPIYRRHTGLTPEDRKNT